MNLQRIIDERNKTLKKMIETFMNVDGILALFLSGSLAEGTSDAYSDIDFRVVVDDVNYQDVLNTRTKYPESWGELLFINSLPNTNYCTSHFRAFFKVDIFYYRTKDIKPSPWYGKGIDILYEKESIISKICEESKHLEFTSGEEDVSGTIDKAISHIHEVYRRAMRGELIYARELLSGFRIRIIESDDFLHKHAPQGYSHYESRGKSSGKNIGLC